MKARMKNPWSEVWDTISVVESLSVMMQKEQSAVYRSSDYLRQPSPSPTPPSLISKRRVVDKNDRAKMVDWCYKVIDTCQFDRETVAVAMDMVDRFLSKSRSSASELALCSRIHYQLLTVTALYIAIKVNELTALGTEFFSKISCNLYSAKDIETMERTLLHELSWCISPPTSIQMANHMLKLISTVIPLNWETWNSILEEVSFQAEMAVKDYSFVTQRSSTIAIAAIANAVDQHANEHSSSIVQAILYIIHGEFDTRVETVALAAKCQLRSLVH